MTTQLLYRSKQVSAADNRYPMTALLDALQANNRPHLQILGAKGGFQACVLADLGRRLGRPLLILSPTAESAQSLANNMELFVARDSDQEETQNEALVDEVTFFPEFDVGPYYQASVDRQLSMQQLTTLYKLHSEPIPRVVVASVGAVLRKTIARQTMRKYSRTFAINDELSNDDARELLTVCGYSEVPLVEDRGTYAMRGDVIDIFSPCDPYPIRLERWGDDIAEVRYFDPETQRSMPLDDDNSEQPICHIYPVRQEVLDDEAVSCAARQLRKLAEEIDVPHREVRDILVDLRAGLHFVGIDALLPALYEECSDLLDYISDNTLVIVVDPDKCVDRAQEILEKRQNEFNSARADGQWVYEPASYYRDAHSFVNWIKGRDQRVEMRQLAVASDDQALELGFPLPTQDNTFEFHARENTDIIQLRKQFQGVEQAVQALVYRLQEWKDIYGRICFVCRTRGQVERLIRLLQLADEDGIALPTPVDVSEPVPPPAGIIEIYQADISEGFRSEMLGLCVIAGSEIFGQRVITKQKKSFTEHASISHFRDLTAGDLVVHVDFGIGRYHGLVHLDLTGVGNDFLHIEYADGDKLYLPVYRLGRVQKYIGQVEGVRLDKLGGTRWEKTKEKVKENIREIAGDLLALYAKRELQKGFSFSPPDDFYREFENRFPFEETPDQANAIGDILDDMTRPRPMDRLVCGDVGFGKTEVAIRAAMKAVMDGKQVAVLVPTTILCEQHRISFAERMKDFGARVEALSRFRSAQESKQIIEDTAQGKVDVVVGTHRLLSKDLAFRELGLLIIDEEQRFGVSHKERLKQLRSQIDVLTLTATPIPRTLQMSLLGIRDLSIIATPPHDRLSVRTHVARYSDTIVREAIMLEISRGGQVFFVHNRVDTIEEMARHLREIIPEARIGIGHGQMPEGKLEEVMLSYINGKINVLLCTTIIESGLDIPNANTIIVNRADRFGLSQLYQLRGRVGRGKQRAYAYLLIPSRATLPADAQKRLEVIQTHTELGSGFQVASYDLEIRGAGNLLSTDQSGHVTAVGLDLYTDLLEEAINDMRGLQEEEDFEPEVNIAVESYLPEDYIPATSLRLMFYKRFSLARTQDELFYTFGELVDRFGEPPDCVRNLRDIISIKIDLRRLRARRLDAGLSAISVELDHTTPLVPNDILTMVQSSAGKWRLTAEMKLIYQLKVDESARPLQTARQIMDKLCGFLPAPTQ